MPRIAWVAIVWILFVPLAYALAKGIERLNLEKLESVGYKRQNEKLNRIASLGSLGTIIGLLFVSLAAYGKIRLCWRMPEELWAGYGKRR